MVTDLVLSAYGGDDFTVMAAQVIQGHDSPILADDVNNGLGHSALVESWFSTLAKLLSVHPFMLSSVMHCSVSQLIIPYYKSLNHSTNTLKYDVMPH